MNISRFRSKNTISVLTLLLLNASLVFSPLQAQQDKPHLALQDIWASRKFVGKFFQRGQWADQGPIITFTKADTARVTHLRSLDLANNEDTIMLDGNKLHAEDVDKLINIEGYTYNQDRSKLLIYTDSAPVWRRNTKGYYYLYNLGSGKLTPLSPREKGYQMFAKFSPDGKHVGFVRNRNLYLVEVASMKETELTSNGSDGAIINGTTDWVYEEEIGLRDGWSWSPDSKHIAFFQFDESATSDFFMVDLRGKKPRDIHFRFPLAGEPNSEVHIGVIDLKKHETKFLETGTWKSDSDEFEYIFRMGWTPKLDGKHKVWLLRMNREQNKAELVYGHPGNMKIRTVLKEEEETWVEVINFFGGDHISYLKDGKHFTWISERDGYKHIYLYKNSGEMVRQLTQGEWRVTQIEGIDEQAGKIYFSGTKASPVERHLYVADLAPSNGSEPTCLTKGVGNHTINMSKDFSYYIDTYSNIDTPPVTGLYKSDGSLVKVLEDNAVLKETLAPYELPKYEFTTIKAADDSTDLHGYVLKPSDFDANKKYPLLVFTYGGPGIQQVRNAWQGGFALWQTFMVEEKDFIFVCFDNRGAAGYGKAFQSANHKRLGTLEPQDQIAVAKYWGGMPYVDASRIAIWGWSYGGTNTLLSMLKYDGPEIFKAGVAVAPGTSHELYDTIYTERYMSTPEKNGDNYAEANLTNFADRLGDDQKLLIVQGDLDDNVHFQNAIQMAAALQKANKQFQLMIYPGGNHGMAGTGNPFTYFHMFTMITNFIVESL